jgi:hypothetical protein
MVCTSQVNEPFKLNVLIHAICWMNMKPNTEFSNDFCQAHARIKLSIKSGELLRVLYIPTQIVYSTLLPMSALK